VHVGFFLGPVSALKMEVTLPSLIDKPNFISGNRAWGLRAGVWIGRFRS
jgi:hypothetical protein